MPPCARRRIANKLVPVLCGSALRNKGVQPLLDAVVRYLPSPIDIAAVRGIDPDTGETWSVDPLIQSTIFWLGLQDYDRSLYWSSGLCACLFWQTRRPVRRSTMPTARRASALVVLVQMYADKREEIKECEAGDIAAIVGLKDTLTGETLCDPDHEILLETIEFPDPVIKMAVEPKSKADQDKLTEALIKLAEEDPTFQCQL